MITVNNISAELNDLNYDNEEARLGAIQVDCVFDIKNKTYWLTFQTGTTHDYGAVNLKLTVYQDDNFEKLSKLVDDEDKLEEIIAYIKEETHAQEIFNEHFEENYTLDDNRIDFRDDRSVNDIITRK